MPFPIPILAITLATVLASVYLIKRTKVERHEEYGIYPTRSSKRNDFRFESTERQPRVEPDRHRTDRLANTRASNNTSERTFGVDSCKLAFSGNSESHLLVFEHFGAYSLKLLEKNQRVELLSLGGKYKLQFDCKQIRGIYEVTCDMCRIHIEVEYPPSIWEMSESEWTLSTKHSDKIKYASIYIVDIESPRYYKSVTEFFDQNGLVKEKRNWNYENYDLSLLLDSELLNSMENLDQQILYTLQSLISHNILHYYNFDSEFIRSLSKHPPRKVVAALQLLSEHRHIRLYNPSEALMSKMSCQRKTKKPKSGCVLMARATITPTSIIPQFYPSQETSNRVLREYRRHQNRFIRVTFSNENSDRLYFNSSTNSSVCQRIMDIITNGFKIGKWKYEFLGISTSQLREGSCWFFSSPGPEVTCDSIRRWMGNFDDIKNPAKYAARMGLCFSSTTETVNLGVDEWEMIDDITKNEYIFSDGIGIISKELAREINLMLKVKDEDTSCYQCRFAGVKGVFAVDPRLTSVKLQARHSMHKFDTSHSLLEVIEVGRALPCFLNRQIIVLLDYLGIKSSIFCKLQEDMVVDLHKILTHREFAVKFLKMNRNSGSTFIDNTIDLLEAGFSLGERFVNKVLKTVKRKMLSDLRTKARIYVKDGALLMGTIDEYRVLEPDQIYIHTSSLGVLENKTVVVTKNPCLHPGDIRVLKAVNCSQLGHMKNCIVFPSKGDRPCPNQISGSDLDGDFYFASWDERLIPCRTHTPATYNSTIASQSEKSVHMADLARFFIDYMQNDKLGMIANAHLVHADQKGVSSRECLELAEQHSTAVDFGKTGNAPMFPRKLRCDKYPDFMEKKDKPTYVSEGIIGLLYRKVVGHMNENDALCSSGMESGLSINGFEKYVPEAESISKAYYAKLIEIMNRFRVDDEVELFVGPFSNHSQKRNDTSQEIQQEIKLLLSSYRKQFYQMKYKKNKKWQEKKELEKKAYAWYHVAYHQAENELENLSFYDRRRNGKVTRANLLLSFGFIPIRELISLKLAASARDHTDQ